jgi:hypothetical protein
MEQSPPEGSTVTTLVMGLYTEGTTDERFLALIAERTAQALLLQAGDVTVDLFPVQCLRPTEKRGQAENILNVARQSHGYHLLLLHADADDERRDRAWNERIAPGIELVRQAYTKGDPLCEHCVPIIPIHMTEAWLLVDADALREVIGTKIPHDELGLPVPVTAAESVADPKTLLKQVMQTALGDRPLRRRRNRGIDELYEPLGRRIRLDQLSRLPAYQQFHTDLAATLTTLKFLKD